MSDPYTDPNSNKTFKNDIDETTENFNTESLIKLRNYCSLLGMKMILYLWIFSHEFLILKSDNGIVVIYFSKSLYFRDTHWRTYL